MSTHNIGFYRELEKNIQKLSSNALTVKVLRNASALTSLLHTLVWVSPVWVCLDSHCHDVTGRCIFYCSCVLLVCFLLQGAFQETGYQILSH